MRFVVDASTAVTWYYREPRSDVAGQLLHPGHELHAPGLLRLETASALARHIPAGDITLQEIESALVRLDSAGLVWARDADLLIAALRISAASKHPIYDCIYLALAHQTGAVLATIDRDLAHLAMRLTPAVSVWDQLLA
jgi:predicted nucleic acid-binding protein